MRARPLLPSALLLTLSAAAHAAGPGEALVGASGGLEAVAVRVDRAGGVVHYKVCASTPCAADDASPSVRVGFAGAAEDAKVEVVELGQGKRAAIVRASSTDHASSFAAVLVGKPDAPVVWSGLTGYVTGQPGGRTGEAVQVIEGDGGARFVVVGSLDEEIRICGQEQTLLAARVLDAATLTLRGASVQRLDGKQRDAASPVVATALQAPPAPPLARLLVSSGASTALGSPQALVDGDPATTWSEARSGAGRGEFVSFSSPAEVPIGKLVVTVAPPGPSKTVAAPRTFFVVASDRTLAVTMPEDAWLHPGAAYEVPLGTPLKTSCLSIVLDDAYARAEPKPDVTLAEVRAYSAAEAGGATLADFATALGGGGAASDTAAGLLKRAGAPGTAAVVAAYDKLDPAGRALAMDVAASAPCEASAPLLVKALTDADAEVSRKAQGKLERCGRAAAPALLEGVRSTAPGVRAKAAGLVALLAPSAALDVLATVLATGTTDDQAQTRRAFATAARSASADKLGGLLLDSSRTADQRLDMLRALDPRLTELGPRASSALLGALEGTPSMRVRYLALGPLVTLARAHDAAAQARFLALLAHDPDAPVRAQAAELATGMTEAQPALVGLIGDPDPRVRDASVRALASMRVASVRASLDELLQKDPWVFVRASAASALGQLPAAADVDAVLGASLADELSPRVRAAVIDALGAHRAKARASDVRHRLDDDREPAFVRASAARALGAMCDVDSYDRLTELAQAVTSPVATVDELAVGLAAIDALGLAHPADVGKRLAPIDEKSVKIELRTAARRAFTGKGVCAP